MTTPITLNQLAHSLIELIPDLNISDVIIPHLNGFMSQKLPEDGKTNYVPLIFLASKESVDTDISPQKINDKQIPFQTITLKELGDRIKQNGVNGSNKKSDTVLSPSKINYISQNQLLLQKIRNSIEENIGDEFYGVDKLAEAVSMSVNNLNRKLNTLINQTAGKLIRSMRLQRAADLLKQKPESIAQIAYETGFSSQASFNRSFKQWYGVSPTTYIREQK